MRLLFIFLITIAQQAYGQQPKAINLSCTGPQYTVLKMTVTPNKNETIQGDLRGEEFIVSWSPDTLSIIRRYGNFGMEEVFRIKRNDLSFSVTDRKISGSSFVIGGLKETRYGKCELVEITDNAI